MLNEGVIVMREKKTPRYVHGPKLRDWREWIESHIDPELSCKELASRAGLDYNHVNRIELGQTNPSVEVLEKYLRALGVPMLYLFLDTHDASDVALGVFHANLLQAPELVRRIFIEKLIPSWLLLLMQFRELQIAPQLVRTDEAPPTPEPIPSWDTFAMRQHVRRMVDLMPRDALRTLQQVMQTILDSGSEKAMPQPISPTLQGSNQT